MRSALRSLLLLWLLSQSLVSAAQIVLREPLLMAGDTLEGVAFMQEEGLTGYAYFLTLFDEEGSTVENRLVWVESQQFHFSLPLSSALPTGNYLLQLTNYQNMAVTHAISLPIVAADGEYVGFQRPKDQALQVPSRSYLQLDVQEDQSSEVKVSIESLLDPQDVNSLTVIVRDLGQNPSLSQDAHSVSCDGVADHRVATRGLNQWMTSFHVEGWLMRGQEPVTGETITLADPTDVSELRYTTTNETGKFGFYNVDFEGDKDVFISPLNGEVSDYKLLLSDSRTSALTPVSSCPVSFNWSEEELAVWVDRRLLSKKVTQYYHPKETPRRQLSLNDPKPLFQEADHTILLDDYVAFETVQEVIKEVVPYVHLTKKRLRVFSPERRKTFEGLPLVLLNGVPLSHDSTLLRLDAEDLHSVQVLNTVPSIAPRGRIANSGVVSFVTRDVTFRLEGAEPQKVAGFSDMTFSTQLEKSDQAPYFPSVLLWEPVIKLQDKAYNLAFDRPDYQTKVSIEVVAQLSNGEVISSKRVLDINRRPR